MALTRNARSVDWAARDDDAAFEQLHARHQPAILAFCRHLTGNREDAEDAVQHTFLAAYRRIADGEQTLEWRPWLFTVARNRCLTLLRARRGEHPLVDPDVATSFDGLAIEVERRQELRDLVQDMARLPEPQRAALVLSQLDALSYREIGAALEVSAAKVKALVFQARSSLASAREAREAPCLDIRREIATARGPELRRRLLRRHVGQCDGCRDFEVKVMRQREDLGILLPVVPTAGLAQAILGSTLGREGAAATSAGGAAVASGGAGAGIAGTLASLGAGGVLKLAVVVAVVGSSAGGAVAANLPATIEHVSPWRADAGGERAAGGADGSLGESGAGSRPPGSDGRPTAPPVPGEKAGGSGGATHVGAEQASAAEVAGGPVDADSGSAGADGQPQGDGAAGLPPGLAKKEELPPGLAKRDELPPGLAKRDGGPPGQSGKAPKGPPRADKPANGGEGRGAESGGPPAASNPGGGNDHGNGVGNGNAGGNAGGGGPGSSSGQGNSGAQGNGGGQGNSNGNGGGNPH